MLSVAPRTLAGLASLLGLYSVDTSGWGKGSSKTISQLLNEVEMEEKLIRVVNAVFIYIQNNGMTLKEDIQTYHATPTREEYSRRRRSVLAEKRGKEEELKDAVKRALEEELGIEYDGTNYEVTEEVEQKFSQSYPNLQCVFYKWNVYITLEELNYDIPDGYTHTEYFENGNPRVTATWRWFKDEPKSQ